MMKISKKVVATTDATLTVIGEAECKEPECFNVKECACGHIQEAINCLKNIVKDDEVAKDAVANLVVIMFDLK